MVTETMKLRDTCSSGKKTMTNLDTILKSSDSTLLTKTYIVNAMIFLEVTYRYEIWTIKQAEAEDLMLSNCGAGEDS